MKGRVRLGLGIRLGLGLVGCSTIAAAGLSRVDSPVVVLA